MVHVVIRGIDGLEPIAKASGATWEEATFKGYDEIVRARGGLRRYLAFVEAEPSPNRKIVRFGFRSSGGSSMESDPIVAVDVERLA